MPFPEYIPVRPVSVGGAMVLESSDLLKVRVTITASKSLVWDATGYRFEKLKVSSTSELGSEIVLNLPRTDVQGWRDPAVNAVIDVSEEGSFTHRYTALIEFLDANDKSIGIRPVTLGPFTVPAGDGTIDLDKTVPASTVSGELVMVPDLWGQLVAQAEAAALEAQAALIDSTEFVRQQVVEDGPVKEALSSTIGAAADGAIVAQVPGLVAQYAPKAVLPTFRRDPAAILSSFQASHGWTTAGTGATWTEDASTYVFGTQSLRVVTGTGQTANATRTGLPSIDGTARTFRVWVKCEDWSKVNRVNLLVSSDPTFAAYFNLTALMNANDDEASRPFKNGEWVPIEYSWVDRTVTGSPTRAALTAVRVLVAPEAGQIATVNIGRVEHVPTPAPYPNGVFTYTLDDSHVSAYTRARPKLSALGHRATLFPINERIDGGADYLTSAQVNELVRIHGWEFGAHADTYANHVAWNGMNQTQRLAMLNAIKSDQNARGFNDSPSFAYPNGHYTQASTDDVRQFYSLARQAGGYRGQLQTPVPFMSMRVRNSSANAGSGTLATLQARLDAAVAEKAWMVVVFHDIVTGSATGNNWSHADFDAFADYVASSGIAVATMQEVLRASAA